jgi:hypothetical protein
VVSGGHRSCVQTLEKQCVCAALGCCRWNIVASINSTYFLFFFIIGLFVFQKGLSYGSDILHGILTEPSGVSCVRRHGGKYPPSAPAYFFLLLLLKNLQPIEVHYTPAGIVDLYFGLGTWLLLFTGILSDLS